MQVDPNYIQGLVGSLSNTQANEQALTNQLSSGLGLTSLSSNPVAVGQSTLLSSALSQDDSYVSAATSAQSMMQVADSALGEVVSQLTSAISIATQGANGTNSAADESTVANQLTTIQSQILSLANTSYQGQYIFGGSQGSVQPYSLDTTSSPATATYHGDTSLQYATTPSGQQIQMNIPGSAIFSATGGDVFGALSQVISDLSNQAPSGTLQGDATALTSALNSVVSQRNVLDNSLSQITSTSSYVQGNATQLEAAQSTLVSSDTASVATQLSSDETQVQALDSTISTLEQNSLFNYMPK
jgi:flagellar hook-associated protein 3 FlgL